MLPRNRWLNRLSKRSIIVLAAASATGGLVNSAFAQSGSWTFNGIGDWSDGFGWLDGVVANGAGELASFSGNGALSPAGTILVTLDGVRTIGALAFSDADQGGSPAGWKIINQGGNVLTLQQVADAFGNTPQPTINVANLGSGTPVIGTIEQRIANINASLGGTMGFNKTNAGTLFLTGDNSAMSGSITMTQGNLLLGSNTALGASTLMTVRTGNVALRSDSALNTSATNITLRQDHVIGAGNSIQLSGGNYGTGANFAHTIGDVTIANYGVRTLTISGSNNIGLNMGVLTLKDGINLNNQGDTGDIQGQNNNNVNGLGSGLVTVGTINYTGSLAGTVNLGGVGSYAGNITVTNGITNTGGGSASLVYSGSKTATVNGSALNGDVFVLGGTTGSTANANFQAGVGTLVLNTSALVSGRNATVAGGTLVLGATTTHNVNTLTMGGATLLTGAGAVPAAVNTTSGTLAIGTGGIVVGTSTQFDPTITVASVQQTNARLLGRLDLGSSNRLIQVDGASTMTVDAVVSGTGGINKQGTGYLNLTVANSLSGATNIGDGVVAALVQASGSALGSPANVSLGGALRVNGIASAGSLSVNNLNIKSTGAHTGAIVDASGGGVTTLSVSVFNGRDVGSNGTFKVVPVTGSLNTNEIVHLVSGAPTTPNNVLPFWMAVQNSGTDTQLSFASLTSNRIVPFAGHVADINTAGANAVWGGSNGALTAARTVYGARVNAGGSISGNHTLTLGNGDGAVQNGGLILNGGALLGAGTLTGNTGDEIVLWSGGATRNTVTSAINLTGDLTTAGSQDLDITSSILFNGSARRLTVSGGTAFVSGASALAGNTSTGFIKDGGGILAVSNTNIGFTGGVTVANGTLQLGVNGGAAGNVGAAPIVNNSALSFNVTDTSGTAGGTFGNNISGSGNLFVNAGAVGTLPGVVSLAGTLSYTGNTTVQTGALRISGTNRLPTTTNLNVLSGATLQLNGNSGQTINRLTGNGTIINNATGDATLTLSSGSFGGSIRAGTGNMALTKVGSDLLVLGGNNTMNRALQVNGGTVQVNQAGSSGAGSIILNNGALAINHNGQIAAPLFTVIGNSTLSVIANQNEQLGTVQDGAGPSIGDNQNVVVGTGTLHMVLNGRQFGFGQTGAGGSGNNPNVLAQFSGTLKFDDNNPVGSTLRFYTNGANPGHTVNAQSTTFAFGNGNLIINHRNGSSQFNMGAVSGGTNTILEGHSNGGNRDLTINMGFLGGDQTYHGMIRDYTTNGGAGFINVQKVSSGTLTLKNTLDFTGGMTVNAGTLFLASGINITNSATIGINGGTLSILPGATITSPRMQIRTTAGFDTGGLNLTAFGGGGFNTPSKVTYTGGGTVYGNANHNAGSINPGAIGGAGTLTFANNLNLSNGSIDFDLTAGSANLLGVSGFGSNDVLQVASSGGLSLTSGVIRLNFLGAGNTPPAELAVNQVYPVIKYNSTYGGATTNMLTVAKFRGSFLLVEGTGTLAGTLGARVVAIGGATNSLVWAPTSAVNNAWDAAVGFNNFQPVGGGGQQFFFNGDSITFDDSTTIRTVQLTPGLAPTVMTVNTNNEYIFTGQGFGSITGSTGITKNGSGTMWIAGTNNFTGGMTINGGTVVVGDPFSNQLSRAALSGNGTANPANNATVIFNNDSDLRFISPGPNTFSGPDNVNLVWNAGSHELIIAGSNQPHNFASNNWYGNGTVVVRRPSLDNNNSNLLFGADDFTNFTGTLKVNDLSDVLLGSNQQNGLRDGTILRTVNTAGLLAGSASMTLDMGQGAGGFQLQAANQTFTMGALRGGINTKLKSNANNSAGTFVIAGVGSQYNATFDGVFKATGGTAGGGGLNDAAIMLVHVVKSGSGSTQTLTASQPYVGNTIVNAGTLALSSPALSTMLSSPTITVNAGGVLDISGLANSQMILGANQRLISNGTVFGGSVQAGASSTIGGTTFGNPIEMEQFSTLSPGNNNVGTLTASNLILNGQADWLIELDATGMDAVVLTGTQTTDIAGATQKVALSIIGAFTPGTFLLLDYYADTPSLVGDLDAIFQADFDENSFAYDVDIVHDTVATEVRIVFKDNSAQWLTDSNGSWSVASNWTSDGVTPLSLVPNSVVFGSLVTAPRTVTTNSTVGNIANSIVFNSPHKYTIAGTGTITLDAGLSVPISVQQGSHAINAPIRAQKTLAVATAAGASISFGGTIAGAVGAGLLKSGAGTATITRAIMPTGTMNVQAGTMTISQKALPNNVEGTSVFTNMTIASGGKLDLTNNAVILDYTALGTMLTVLRAELADGRLFSSTTASNTTLGYRVNNTGTTPAGGTGTAGLGLAPVASFGGVAVDNSSVLIRVTYKGDSNLDGIVNVIDLYNMSQNWLTTNGVWAGGDFNYDGLVNQADLTLLAQGWQLGNNSPLPADDLGAALTAAGIPLNAVPEPSTLALAGVAGAGLLGRRRRRN